MAKTASPILWLVDGDSKRLQWLVHHVTSEWPSARITAAPAHAPADALPDAAILLIDFGSQGSADAGLDALTQLLAIHPELYCIVLAQRGSEGHAVRTLKRGAKDYLPLAELTGAALLQAIAEAAESRGALRDPGTLDASGTLHAADEALVPAELPPPQVPNYIIVKEIASSNFSAVFLAKSERLRRNVVLKIMRRGTSEHEIEDAGRFQREYEIISSIAHPAIAEIYEVGALADCRYLAMEYIPCGSLRDRLRNPLSVAESLYYLRSLAEALCVIHACGVLHRDLKPANVMLREDNSPVLIDFGLARRSQEDTAATAVGQVLGSPYYISPEQSQGHPVDARTDLYSLGVVFYEMLTGERPYAGRTALAIMAQHAGALVPRLPSHLASQQPLLDRLMAKRMDLRYGSAQELLADLGSGITAVA